VPDVESAHVFVEVAARPEVPEERAPPRPAPAEALLWGLGIGGLLTAVGVGAWLLGKRKRRRR